ncbi:MAG: ATPase [Firmicutes bacterium]|nr:ATPase [Bacillota bacterium]
MILSVLMPQGQLFRGRVQKVVARGAGGSRGFLPHHIDFVTVLAPSILSAVLEDGSERFFAVNGGVLVKKGDQVMVTTRHGIVADRLEALPDRLETVFAAEEEQERHIRRVLFQLESHLVKELLEWVT